MRRALEDNEKEDGPQVCQRVETGTKIPMHERHNKLHYQHTAVENLTVAIYQCEADLKKFNDRYED